MTLALFSNKYIERYFTRSASGCPSLSTLDTTTINGLIFSEQKRVKTLRYAYLELLVLIPAFTVGYLLLLAKADNSPYYFYFALGGQVFVVILEFVIVIPVRRKHYELFVIRRLFFLVRSLERNAAHWGDTCFRTRIAQRIENTAKAIERIPLSCKGIAPEVRRDLFVTSRMKAQALRELELWTIKPGPFTFTDLVGQLTCSLRITAKGQWYDLPGTQYSNRISRLLISLEIGVIITALGGVITLVIFSAKIGPVVPVLTTILSAVIFAVLNRVGLPASVIERYVETGAKVTSKGS